MNQQKKTVLITGASSGIGLATALYFYEKGWNVVATMRNPEKRQTLLHEKGLPDILHLDVLDKSSIEKTLHEAVEKYPKIDVLVNNAGFAVFGPFEATTPDQISRQYQTNVFGLMEMTRSILPVFRRQKGGVLINVASMAGRIGFPLYSIYNSTKWAVDGFSEALYYELKALNIKVKIIEPGVIKTDFYDRSMSVADCSGLVEDYGPFLNKVMGPEASDKLNGSTPDLVAKVIYQAANDPGWQLRYTAGNDAWQIMLLRTLLPESLFKFLVEKVMSK